MKAVIMAGGFGTRLRPVTCNIPKPMAPVVNKPLMEHIVDRLRDAGIRDILAILYFQPEAITEYFGDGSKFGVKIEYVTAAADYGTAGSVRNAKEFLDERFIVISGDVMTDFKLWDAVKFHEQKKALSTIMLTRVENPLAFGIVITDEQGKIIRFLEKPSWGQVFSDTINTGIYIMEPEALDLIPEKTEFDFSKNLFPLMLEKGDPLFGYIARGYWKDVGNLTEYRQVNMDVIQGKVKVSFLEQKQNTIGYDLWTGQETIVEDDAKISGGVLIGKNCIIRTGADLKDVVLGDGCTVDSGVRLKDSVFWNNCHIGQNGVVKKALIGSNCRIGSDAYVEEEAIISDDCIIGESATVRAGIKMWPGKVLEDGAVLSSSLIWGEKWNRELFGAEGITGIANAEITPEFGAKLGAALGATLGRGAVVATSRDTHRASRLVNRAIISGLLSVGVDVYDLQVIPECVSRYQIAQTTEAAGIHTRKSPFSPSQIDIKFIDSDGMNLPLGKQKNIERLFLREDFRRAGIDETGNLSFPYRVLEYYQSGVLNFISSKKIASGNFKLVLDYAYGPATNVFPSILAHFGCEVISLNTHTDEKKLTKSYENFRQDLLQLSNITRSLGSSLGIMFDSGVEKIYIVDELGNILPDDVSQAMMIYLALFTCGEKGRKIAVPVSSSANIEKIAKKFSAEVIRTRTSHRGIMEAASSKDILIAADGKGGFIFPAFNQFFDGMVSVSKLLEMLSQTGRPLSVMTMELPASCVLEAQVPCPFEMKGTVMRKIVENSSEEEQQLIDGVRICRGDEWALLIPDPDRSYFLVYAEGPDKQRSRALLDEYCSMIRGYAEEN